MRKGTVISYNAHAAVGLVEDEHGEHIKFFNEMSIPIQRRDKVEFNICFSSAGLLATHLRKIGISEENKKKWILKP